MAKEVKKSLTKSAADVVRMFDASWLYQKTNHHPRWERNQKIYNNKRAIISYKGTTNTFVPLPFSIVESATAALTAGRPSIDFMPQDMYNYIQSYFKNGVKPDLKALNAQFDYWWDCDNWDLLTVKTVRNTFTIGIGCEYGNWDGDKPRFMNLHARDAIIDPNLRDPSELFVRPKDYYTGRRYLTTKDALQAETIVDPETGELKPRFKNLRDVRTGTTGSTDTEKQEKEMFLGSISDTKDMVEVIEINDGSRIRSIANRSIEIEDRENKLGIHFLVIHRFIADESIIYGKAILDPIAHPTELLNDVTNQSVDAVTDQLAPQYELDPMYSDHIEKVNNAPGTVYPFTPGSLKQIEKNPVSPQAFNERENMKNEIREAVGMDQIVQGGAADGGTTATEINAQLSQAGQRFELYVRMLEKECLYQRAKIAYKMWLYYVKEQQLIPTNTMDGPKFRAVDPNQFDDTYEPKIQLEAAARSQKQRVAQKSTESYEILISDPTNDLYETKKIMYPKMFDLSEEELDRIIGPQKPMGMPAPMGQEEAAGAPVAPSEGVGGLVA
jgi:hypothetical protein